MDDQMWLVHPNLKNKLIGNGKARFDLSDYGISISASEKLSIIIDRLKLLSPFYSDHISNFLDNDIFRFLVNHYFLIENSKKHILVRCPCVRDECPVGKPILLHEIQKLQASDIVILHAPILTTNEYDVSVARGGKWVRKFLTNMFPNAILNEQRHAVDLDFREMIPLSNLGVFDLGNIQHDALAETQACLGEKLQYLCSKVIQRKSKIIILGGDHSQSYYTVGSLSQVSRNVGVLQFDAHTDLYVNGSVSDNIMNHANVYHWVKEMSHVKEIWQVGLRDIFVQDMKNVHLIKNKKINTVSAYEANIEGFDRLLNSLDRKLDWFISFDVDVISNLDIPETATPVLGGLDFYSILSLIETLLKKINIIGIEIVEVGGGRAKPYGPAAIAARIISRFIFSQKKTICFDGKIFESNCRK